MPKIAEIAERLLAVGRAEEAGRTLAAAEPDQYDILEPAAEALAARHPLAATLALRAMIDFTLGTGRSTRYRHAARHMQECAGLAATTDFADFETHDAYLGGLRESHGRKRSFWELVS